MAHARIWSYTQIIHYQATRFIPEGPVYSGRVLSLWLACCATLRAGVGHYT